MTTPLPTTLFHIGISRPVYHKDSSNRTEPGKLVHSCHTGKFYKLIIVHRDTDAQYGELNYELRIQNVNFHRVKIYCIMDQPNHIFTVLYCIERDLSLADTEPVTEPDLEMIRYMLLDFIYNHLAGKYTLTDNIPEGYRPTLRKLLFSLELKNNTPADQ